MRPETRSVFIAIIAGMMASGYLDSTGRVDFSFGFAKGGLAEGAFIALIGAAGGYLVLLAFRMLRKLVSQTRD